VCGLEPLPVHLRHTKSRSPSAGRRAPTSSPCGQAGEVPRPSPSPSCPGHEGHPPALRLLPLPATAAPRRPARRRPLGTTALAAPRDHGRPSLHEAYEHLSRPRVPRRSEEPKKGARPRLLGFSITQAPGTERCPTPTGDLEGPAMVRPQATTTVMPCRGMA